VGVFGGGVVMVGDVCGMVVAPKGSPLPALDDLIDPHEDIVSRVLLPEERMLPMKKRTVSVVKKVVHLDSVQELVDQVSSVNMNATLQRLAYDFGTPNSRNSNADGLDDAVEWVAQQFSAMGLDVSFHSHQSTHALNVIGTLPGLLQSSIVIGAHLDSRNSGSNDVTNPAPGADDNGSGSVAVLELARIITSSSLSFLHTIRFCLWSGEEQGLLGSRSYARLLSSEDEDVVAYINADMIGYRVAANSNLSLMSGSASAALNNEIEQIVNVYVPYISVERTNACCSDQQSFYEVGYESAGFFEHQGGAGSYPCYHQQCDTPSQIDFDMLEDNAKAFMAATVVKAEIQE